VTPSLRVVIVDDEPLARALLRELLAAHADIAIVAECANGFEAVKAVTEQAPDLLLLDVQMPKLDGFDVLELIGREMPVIFVTAYDSFAIRAFDAHAVDYLLKPFGAERLGDALSRARLRIRASTQPPSTSATAPPPASVVRDLVSTARASVSPLGRILIRDRADVHVIPVEKIDYIESQDDYVAVKVGGRSLLKEQTLAELEALLDRNRFVRIHRRYLLNLTRLAKIEQSVTESRVAVLTDGTELPISRTGYARLRELL
jgi:two-component system, LytTR family, response regulator